MRSFPWVATILLAATVVAPTESLAANGFTNERITQVRTLGQFAASPDGSSVAYTISGFYLGFPLIPRFGEENNLRIVATDTGEITQVTSGLFAKTNPVFSPSGRYLAFESEKDIWTVEVATGVTRRLTTTFAGFLSRSPS